MPKARKVRRGTRRDPLVIEHLEHISRKALEEYQAILRAYVKGRFGIYALYRKDKLYYVGLASNLRNRLKAHLRDRHETRWDRFSLYLTTSGQHLRELEAFILRILKPKGNVAKTRLSMAKDLRKILRRRIQEEQRTQLASLFEYVPNSRRGRTTRPKPGRGRKVRLSDVIEGRMRIRLTYKGKAYDATVRKSGIITLKGKTYSSPSAAAGSIIPRSVNGWSKWKYESSPGRWVKLKTLRG